MGARDDVLRSFATGSAGADLAVIEGVMGLFDGADGAADCGSSAEIARWLGGKILLVVDARAQARSAAAVVHGFTTFAPDLMFAGVLYNRVGSASHERLLREAHASRPGLPPLLGCLPRSEAVALPERHLGLVTADETAAPYARLADWVTAHVDLDDLLGALAGSVPTLASPAAVADPVPRDRVRIGVARDAAFCFCYPENLELLERAGAELVLFSPLTDPLPDDLAGLYLPGGYPELHGARLAANEGLLTGLRRVAAAGMPVYAECGGLLLLAASLDGVPLAGIFPAAARMLPKRQALGYREVTMLGDTLLGPAGTTARGHEFHYSELTMPDDIPRGYRLAGRDGTPYDDEGYLRGNVLGSYVHLHFASNPVLAENFVACCRRWRDASQ
jgi:cobyrinic acid a,c-diamide synthase